MSDVITDINQAYTIDGNTWWVDFETSGKVYFRPMVGDWIHIPGYQMDAADFWRDVATQAAIDAQAEALTEVELSEALAAIGTEIQAMTPEEKRRKFLALPDGMAS